MTAYTYTMSNDLTTPNGCLTEIIPAVPARRSILAAARAGSQAGQPERSPFADWRGQAQTEELPAGARVSTPTEPTGGRVRLGALSSGTKGPRRSARPARGRVARHLRAALAGLLIAAAVLIPMQLFAARGISSARQAALQDRQQTSASAVPMSGQSTHSWQGAHSPMSGQNPAQPEWVAEHTGAAYDRTNPAASPLDLPRCTTSPDTPLPCLATISPDSRRAVVLKEDASLTALVHR